MKFYDIRRTGKIGPRNWSIIFLGLTVACFLLATIAHFRTLTGKELYHVTIFLALSGICSFGAALKLLNMR